MNMKVKGKKALIDIGGGLRGMYATGVLDYLIDHDIRADLCIGVSAGSANLATYIARQKGRCYTYYHDYAFRPQYFSLRNYFKSRSAFDFDYIFSTLSNSDGEYPIDYPVLEASPIELVTVATNAITGRPAYFDKSRMAQDDYRILKGSCAIPFLCHPWPIANLPFCDGTVSDPIPIDKALELGSQHTVILFPRNPKTESENPMLKWIMDALARSSYGRRYPSVSKALAIREAVNRRSLQTVEMLEEQGKALLLSPASLHHVQSLWATPEQLEALYWEGYRDGAKVQAFFEQ